VYRFNVVLPDDAAWANDFLSSPALSPDGSMLVYNGRDSSGVRRLYLRTLAQIDPVPLAGSENGASPFFSPDGRRVGFSVGTRLMRVAVAGGTAESLCESTELPRATWLESGMVVFTDRTGLRQCAVTGQVRTLIAAEAGEFFHHAHALPDDRAVLFAIQRDRTNTLAVADLQAGSVKRLEILGSDPRYVETGYLVYASPDGRIRAVPFDSESLSVSGDPVVIEEQVPVVVGEAVMAVSRTGVIIVPGGGASQTLVSVDRSGARERLYPTPGNFGDPRVSPEGRRIAVRLDDDIWLFDRTQETLTRLSFEGSASRPSWSRDGRRIAYIHQTANDVVLRILDADGTAPGAPLLDLPNMQLWEAIFTPDDGSILVRTAGGSGGRDVWLATRDTARPTPLLTTTANETAIALSPDGRWLAYVSDESGRAEVYVRSFPGMSGRYQVSTAGGSEPAWSSRGDELFYRSGPTLLAARLRAGVGFEVVSRTPLFSDGSYVADVSHPVYDVTPDGKRFVMVQRLEATSYLAVTLNWFQNLRAASLEQAPVGRRN
jgi:serine/threonine-protein kinase